MCLTPPLLLPCLCTRSGQVTKTSENASKTKLNHPSCKIPFSPASDPDPDMAPGSSVRRSLVVLLEHGEVLVDVVRGTQNHGDPLVDVVGLDVQHIHAAGGGEASSLLHDERHGVALIQQPQLKGEEMEDSNMTT